MDKVLNLENLHAAMERAGLSQTSLARQLDVSKEAVSKWLSGNKYPRPAKLLRLAQTVGLGLDDLVIRQPDAAEPVIAFRKRGASKTTAAHIENAKDMGRLLSALVPRLPYDLLVQPATLKNPSLDYDYIQKVAAKFREEIGVGPEDTLDFAHLIRKFNELQAVIVPVLRGRKDKHENALHIYLPDSMTTWVYLNLDVEIHDFKFWMAHELGHVLASDLRGDEAEDFADAFAGALLFPEQLARKAYKRISSEAGPGTRMNALKAVADGHLISPITVYMEMNRYARHRKLPSIDLGKSIFGAAKNLSKRYHVLSTALFEERRPSPSEYVRLAEEIFATPFFETLQKYIHAEGKGSGFVQSILDIPLLDAREIHAELS